MKRKIPALLATLATAALIGAVSAQTPVTTIQYWNINTEAFGAPAVRDLIAKFESKNPGIKIESRAQTGYTGLLQNAQTAIAAGSPPDVVQIGYLYTNYVFENLPFQDIRKLATAQKDSHLTGFTANVLELGQVGSNLVGMPYSLSNMIGYVNTDLVKKAGLEITRLPRTWAEWQRIAPGIKEKTGKYAISMGYNDDNWSIEGLVSSNGGSLLSCVGDTYKATFDSPEAVQALELWSGLVKSGLWLNANYQQGEQAFLAGETLVHFTTIGSRANYQKNAKFELRGVPYPKFGSKAVRLPGGGNVLSIFSKDPAKLEASWKFMKFLTSPDGFTTWTKGTGYVPLQTALAYDKRYLRDFIAENPIQQVGVNQLKNVIRWTSFPGANGLAAGQALFKGVQASLSGSSNAKAALTTAATEANRLIAGERCKK